MNVFLHLRSARTTLPEPVYYTRQRKSRTSAHNPVLVVTLSCNVRIKPAVIVRGDVELRAVVLSEKVLIIIRAGYALTETL